ncbi:cobalamin 5'-phosphate synthase [Salinisphaera sp. T5B8]|uniref:adenosylcobinamide-GDP ribazoletransferase n=1 Tax=Salinisphaera sp. T5B8 TaxID=1304154 RepID=UPI00333E5BFA
MRRLIAFFQPLWLAFGLLTTLPMARLIRSPVSAADSGRSVLCYPLVGLAIGALLAGLASALHGIDAMLGAALVVVLWVVITGALHLDGLADCVDALFAGHGQADAERTLAVMKDPAAGPMAVVALVLVLALKSAALIALWPQAGVVVLVVPMLARTAAGVLMATTRYRRRQGLASAMALNLSRRDMAVVAAIVMGLTLAFAGIALGLATILAAFVVGLTWRALWQRRIGGYTGDVIGALIELVEAAALVIAALVAAVLGGGLWA